MSGETEIYPFSPEFDELKLQNNLQYTVFGFLIDSGFAGREWRARGNAFHAKSKTYLS